MNHNRRQLFLWIAVGFALGTVLTAPALVPPEDVPALSAGRESGTLSGDGSPESHLARLERVWEGENERLRELMSGPPEELTSGRTRSASESDAGDGGEDRGTDAGGDAEVGGEETGQRDDASGKKRDLGHLVNLVCFALVAVAGGGYAVYAMRGGHG